jgi:hypothetical protein
MGQYIDGKPNGIGTYTWKNGSIYKGDFKEGLKQGRGIWASGKQHENSKYEGDYYMDKKNGFGIFRW